MSLPFPPPPSFSSHIWERGSAIQNVRVCVGDGRHSFCAREIARDSLSANTNEMPREWCCLVSYPQYSHHCSPQELTHPILDS